MPMLPKVIVVKSRHGGIWSLFRSRRTCIATRRDATYEFVDPKIIATLEVGPYRPFTWPCRRCGAARHSRPSLQVQNRADSELAVCGTERDFAAQGSIDR
tara:strand:+ start:1222 stop:1521 length:300 start_codon:yes stop_codon:yes gene_type:complete